MNESFDRVKLAQITKSFEQIIDPFERTSKLCRLIAVHKSDAER